MPKTHPEADTPLERVAVQLGHLGLAFLGIHPTSVSSEQLVDGKAPRLGVEGQWAQQGGALHACVHA